MSVTTRTVLVTGGAGISGKNHRGAPRTKRAISRCFWIIFSTGHRDSIQGMRHFEVELTDLAQVETVFAEVGPIHSLLHFAAKAVVPEIK